MLVLPIAAQMELKETRNRHQTDVLDPAYKLYVVIKSQNCLVFILMRDFVAGLGRQRRRRGRIPGVAVVPQTDSE